MADEEKSSSTDQRRDVDTTTSKSDGLSATIEVDTTDTELHTSAHGYVIVPSGPLSRRGEKAKSDHAEVPFLKNWPQPPAVF